jgi:hypothetical protein
MLGEAYDRARPLIRTESSIVSAVELRNLSALPHDQIVALDPNLPTLRK